MSRLPAGLDEFADVFVAEATASAVYHLANAGRPACFAAAPHRVSAGHASHGLCGSPCPSCWPDPYGLAALNRRPYMSPASVRDRNIGAAVCGPAQTCATTS